MNAFISTSTPARSMKIASEKPREDGTVRSGAFAFDYYFAYFAYYFRYYFWYR